MRDEAGAPDRHARRRRDPRRGPRLAARDGTEANEWRVAATLRFRSDDVRYAWLDGALGLWEGGFDAAKHRARYRAYLQRGVKGQR